MCNCQNQDPENRPSMKFLFSVWLGFATMWYLSSPFGYDINLMASAVTGFAVFFIVDVTLYFLFDDHKPKGR